MNGEICRCERMNLLDGDIHGKPDATGASFICTPTRTQLSPVISVTDCCVDMIDYQYQMCLRRIRTYKDLYSLGIAYLTASIDAAE